MTVGGGNEGGDGLLPALSRLVAQVLAEFDQIPDRRRAELEALAVAVQRELAANGVVRMMFICTHNSRRSHLSQVWMQTAAHYFGVKGIETYSGGTEATACNPRTVRALRRAGFAVVNTTPGAENPRYLVQYAEDAPALRLFSKVYDQGGNPTADYFAVMTCSHADENCPLVRGSSRRFAIPYVDPKAADDTDAEAATYDARCRQIAREFCFVGWRLAARA